MKHRRYWASALAVGTLALGNSGTAFALNHASVLHTGGLVIAISSPAIFSLPASEVSPSAKFQVAILPDLLKDVKPLNRENPWTSAKDRLLSPSESAALKPYVKQIQALHWKEYFTTFANRIVRSVSWVEQSSPLSLPPETDLLDTKKTQTLTQGSDSDAVAFLQPLAVFSPDFKKVYVITPVAVYARGPVRAFLMDSATLYTAVPIGHTRPELKTFGIESLAASDRRGETAARARVRVWFAQDANRLKQALAIGLERLQKPLTRFLSTSR